MRPLDLARNTCEQFHPGLCDELGKIPLLKREAVGSPVVGIFRAHDGPGLMAPVENGGGGASALDAVRVLRAISSYSPSLGVIAANHHFTVAQLFGLMRNPRWLTDAQTELLKRVVTERLLLASGWAEGRTAQSSLVPAVTATPTAGGYLINGSKKPCSGAHSMDVLTASVALPTEDGQPDLGLALIPADRPGMSVHPLWSTYILAAAENEEVRLNSVLVPGDLIIQNTPEDPGRIDALLAAGFIWYELLISAAYTGAPSDLAERVVDECVGNVTDRCRMMVKLESAMLTLESVARAVMMDDVANDDVVAGVLVARYTAQEALNAAADLATEALGGMRFVESAEISYMNAATRPLVFHTPSRSKIVESMVKYFSGHPLTLM